MTEQLSANEDSRLYSEEGYCVQRRVLAPSDIAALRRSLDRMIEELPEDRRLESLVEPHIHAADWKTWLELGRDERLLSATGEMLGCEELLLMSTHLLVKPPRDGLALCWHQDNTYWPGVSGVDVCTVWLALDDSDLANGCMKVIPRTQDGCPELEMIPTDGGDLLGVRVEVTGEMESAAVAIELGAGDLSIHDSYIIHGSDRNESDRRRAGLTLRYANAATVRVDLEKHGKPVYYVGGCGGSLAEGQRDISGGRPLPDDPGIHRSRRFENR